MDKDTVEIGNTEKLMVYQSAIDDSNINIDRAENLAKIIKYDKDVYNDINIETVIKACEIAGIIQFHKSKERKAGKKIPKWELDKKGDEGLNA